MWSDDGIEWTKTRFESITRQATLRLTPDEPASLGGSGVSGVTVAEGQIVATGWVTENDLTSPVLWAGDGTNWVQSSLPVVERATQGGQVAVSPLGQIVTLIGGSHYGFGTYFRTFDSGWELVEPSIDDDGSERFTRQVAASDRYFYRFEFSHLSDPLLSRSGDGVSWTEVELPAADFESLGVHVAKDDRVSVFDQRWIVEGEANPIIWTSADDGWTALSYEGTRIISLDDKHVVTASDDQIFVYEISG